MKIAIVQVRGLATVSNKVRTTMESLNLGSANNCVVVEDTPSNLGMIKVIKDFVTFGPISDDFFAKIVAARGREFLAPTTDRNEKYSKGAYFEFNGKNYHKRFSLNPPSRGFERKGIKTPFTMGGALGNRGEAIEQLIERML